MVAVRDLDFFADLVTTGTVLGLDHTSALAEVEAVLGRDLSAEPDGHRLNCDFGLVEFGWQRDGAGRPWEVVHFGAQTHRLPWLVDSDHVLVPHYGRFRARLDFADLRAAVTARGFELEERGSSPVGCAHYWQPDSGMGLLVVTDEEEAGQGEPAGTVLKILGPQSRPVWERFVHRERAFRDQAAHLLTLSDAARAAWLDAREPEPGPERAGWWGYLRHVVERRALDGRRAGWPALGLALDRAAAERGVWPADEAAVRVIVAILASAAEPGELDAAVQRWLTVLPVTYAEAVRLCAARPGPAGIRTARRLRNQLHEVRDCVPRLASAALADEVRAWMELRPALLGRR
ncbi:hypothetical protein HII36_35605 [Nonomuraea sp. NN258]|uniref:hypothetical protein n=1 Tax=Nonomuraea antri TaxID=2730852 RepID=UPI001568F55B|nr:hypothetical protein [Nonomuraea antri]NRQ37123.1 hypothetical protein [Nonomuraea antri]